MKFLAPKNQYRRKLYKYFSKIEYVIDCVINKRIHCERLKDYNDIFDGCFEVTADKLHLHSNNMNGSLINFKKMLKNNNLESVLDIVLQFEQELTALNNLQEIVNYVDNLLGANNYNLAQRIADYLNQNAKNEDSNNILCTCFSENNLSIPMWSYYANKHKGFCLEFDLTTPEALKDSNLKYLTKVMYSDNYLEDNNITNAFFTKSTEWQHEQEWRFIIDLINETDGTYLQFPYLSAIYFGVRSSNNDIETIKKLLNTHDIDLYQMKKVDNRFQISPQKIIY